MPANDVSFQVRARLAGATLGGMIQHSIVSSSLTQAAFLLEVMAGGSLQDSAFMRNATPLPVLGDTFEYFRSEDGSFHSGKVLSRTFTLNHLHVPGNPDKITFLTVRLQVASDAP